MTQDDLAFRHITTTGTRVAENVGIREAQRIVKAHTDPTSLISVWGGSRKGKFNICGESQAYSGRYQGDTRPTASRIAIDGTTAPARERA